MNPSDIPDHLAAVAAGYGLVDLRSRCVQTVGIHRHGPRHQDLDGDLQQPEE